MPENAEALTDRWMVNEGVDADPFGPVTFDVDLPKPFQWQGFHWDMTIDEAQAVLGGEPSLERSHLTPTNTSAWTGMLSWQGTIKELPDVTVHFTLYFYDHRQMLAKIEMNYFPKSIIEDSSDELKEPLANKADENTKQIKNYTEDLWNRLKETYGYTRKPFSRRVNFEDGLCTHTWGIQDFRCNIFYNSNPDSLSHVLSLSYEKAISPNIQSAYRDIDEISENYILNGLSSVDAEERMAVFEEVSSSGMVYSDVLRRILKPYKNTPHRWQQVSSPLVHAGEPVTCRWYYEILEERGVWYEPDLPAPLPGSIPYESPIVVTGSLEKRAVGRVGAARTAEHKIALRRYRLWRNGDEGTVGQLDYTTQKQGVIQFEWEQKSSGYTVSVYDSYVMRVAELPEGGGSQVVVLPAKAAIGAAHDGLMLKATYDVDQKELTYWIELVDSNLERRVAWSDDKETSGLWIMIISNNLLIHESHFAKCFIMTEYSPDEIAVLNTKKVSTGVRVVKLPNDLPKDYEIWYGFGPVTMSEHSPPVEVDNPDSWWSGSLAGKPIEVRADR